MAKTVQMLKDRPNGSGGVYAKGSIQTLADDLADHFRSTSAARLTAVVSEKTGEYAQLSAAGKSFVKSDVLQTPASLTLAPEHDGLYIVATAANVTITVPQGLSLSFGGAIKGHSDGTTKIVKSGSVTLNGATTDITIAASKYIGFQCSGTLNAFDVIGV